MEVEKNPQLVKQVQQQTEDSYAAVIMHDLTSVQPFPNTQCPRQTAWVSYQAPLVTVCFALTGLPVKPQLSPPECEPMGPCQNASVV